MFVTFSPKRKAQEMKRPTLKRLACQTLWQRCFKIFVWDYHWGGALASACDPYVVAQKLRLVENKNKSNKGSTSKTASCLFDSGSLPETNSKSTWQDGIPKGNEPSSNPSIFRGENVRNSGRVLFSGS